MSIGKALDWPPEVVISFCTVDCIVLILILILY